MNVSAQNWALFFLSPNFEDVEQIDIKDIPGNTLLTTLPNEGCKRKFTLMKEDYITLKFSLESPIFFKLGSYVECDFGLFEVCDLQKPVFNTDNAGYDYELQLDAHYWKWKNKIFKYTPEVAGQEASWNLTASLDVQAGIVLRNLKALGYKYKGQDFVFSIDGTVENKAQLMSYDNVNILDACFSMAKKWDCECWITENIIHFGRCEFGDAVNFEIGKNVDKMSRSDSQSTYATRIYAFGSTRNIPANYRPVDESVVVNGVVQRRLMLPAGTPYIDAYPNMTTEEAIEQVVVFDDVHPRRVGTMSDITTHEYTDTIKEEGKPDVVTKWNAYRFKDSGITFSKDYILPGEELKITFHSGKLNGMIFGVTFDPDNKDEQLWEIVRNEDYGRPLPDEVLCPENGDTYVLSGWDSTKIAELGLVSAAEQELKGKTEKYAEKSRIDPSTYGCTMMSDVAYREDGVHILYGAGQKVNLINKAYFENGRLSRVIGFEFNLDLPYDSPIYTVGETAAYSRIGELEEKIDSVTLQGQTYVGGGGSGVYVIKRNDSTPATDSNVFSALRSLGMFLRKDQPDSTDHLTGFNAGAIFGASGFAEGLTGFGAKIDSMGRGYMESLTLRRFLEVPELRFNRAEIVLGDKWRSPGAGIIESVEPDYDADGNLLRSGTISLKLQDGEIGAVAVDDICMGYFHDYETPGNNAVSDMDDSRGNRMFAGFCTFYFRITEILDAGTNKRFRYVLRGISDRWQYSFHPCAALHFVAYGNFTNKDRQTSAYETRTYRRFLVGMNDWEFTKSMIAMQDGDLSNLNIFGLEMTGYSAYLNNIYMTGTIEQLQIEAPVRIEIDTQGDNFLAYGESMDITCKVFKGWEDITDTVRQWTIRRDSGDTADDEAWNIKHKEFNGSITIYNTKEISDLGNNSVTVVSTLFTITATNETAVVEAILTI